MDDEKRTEESGIRSQNPDELREVVRAVIEEFAQNDKRRETLEQRVNELVAENQRARAKAEEAERTSAIRAELQRLGVAKIDLAYRAVKDDIYRSEDGRLVAQGGSEMRDYLAQFVGENPELLPARVSGGVGTRARGREAGRRRDGGAGPDPSGNERGRDGQSAAGSGAGGVADAARVS